MPNRNIFLFPSTSYGIGGLPGLKLFYALVALTRWLGIPTRDAKRIKSEHRFRRKIVLLIANSNFMDEWLFLQTLHDKLHYPRKGPFSKSCNDVESCRVVQYCAVLLFEWYVNRLQQKNVYAVSWNSFGALDQMAYTLWGCSAAYTTVIKYIIYGISFSHNRKASREPTPANILVAGSPSNTIPNKLDQSFCLWYGIVSSKFHLDSFVQNLTICIQSHTTRSYEIFLFHV